MVQSVIDVGDEEDRVLNIVKAKYGFKNKSQAVSFLAKVYRDSFLEPELRPEYLSKLKRVDKERGIPFKNIQELKKIIED